MEQSYIILLIILTLGLLIKNNPLAISSSLLILLKLLKLDVFFPKLEANGLKLGVIILTIGILTPIAEGQYTIKDILTSVKSPLGISAIIAGTLVILFTSKGYVLLTEDPAIVIPIVIGSILGLIFFKGVPVGPLIAAGITVIIYNISKCIEKLIP